jgi:hypothetical protein
MSTLLFLLFSWAQAATCDAAIFSTIPQPMLDSNGKGVATGEATGEGKKMVGARVVRASNHSIDAWKPVLIHGELQDEWMPAEFGYEQAELIDSNHMYLLFDIGFLMNAVRVQRQLVVELSHGMVGNSFRLCWKMVDPTPYMAKIQHLVTTGVEWERSSMGWWEVTPAGSGAMVTYQWWTEVSAMPVSVMRYGASQTLPNLLEAFEVKVGG